MLSTKLIKWSDEKYDLDSNDGQRICKRFLNQLEWMCEVSSSDWSQPFGVKTASRDYWKEFSQAYRVLFVDQSLCYLTEILDSAQEGRWTNVQDFLSYTWTVKSTSSVKTYWKPGKSCFMDFAKYSTWSRIYTPCKWITSSACDENPHVTLEEIRNDIKVNLEEFDKYWVTFE